MRYVYVGTLPFFRMTITCNHITYKNLKKIDGLNFNRTSSKIKETHLKSKICLKLRNHTICNFYFNLQFVFQLTCEMNKCSILNGDFVHKLYNYT